MHVAALFFALTSATPLVSNVLRADYAGTAACAACHQDIAASFATSPMHNMTRPASSITAPFDGATYSFKGDSATAFSANGRRYMKVSSQKKGEHLYAITEVIGGRVREDFAGVEVPDVNAALTGDALIMPASYLLYAKRWRYKGYSVMVPERPGLAAGPVWRETCLYCHNETPYLTTIYNFIESPARTVYQGSVSDGFLPAARRLAFTIDDPAGLARAVDDEDARIGAPARDTAAAAASAAAYTTRKRYGAHDLVEIGIGCESCHNGSKAHASSAGAVPSSLLPTSPLFHFTNGDGTALSDAQQINRTCVRCHTVLFSQYPFTWEGGRRDDGAGGSSINSGEARDFLMGGCASKLSCVQCHDPHGADDKNKLAALGTTAGNGVCVACHAEIGRDVAAHTHHKPDGEGSACLACHMPKKNAGLDGRLTRYHRIGAPTDDARVTGDRPLECALCHADKSVHAIVSDMERLWGKRYDRVKLGALYGDLDQNALLATLARGKAHEQIAAAGALGAHGVADDVPTLVHALAHPYPIVRPYVKSAIEALSHQPMDVDLDLDAGALDVAARAWLARQGPEIAPTSTAPASQPLSGRKNPR